MRNHRKLSRPLQVQIDQASQRSKVNLLRVLLLFPHTRISVLSMKVSGIEGAAKLRAVIEIQSPQRTTKRPRKSPATRRRTPSRRAAP